MEPLLAAKERPLNNRWFFFFSAALVGSRESGVGSQQPLLRNLYNQSVYISVIRGLPFCIFFVAPLCVLVANPSCRRQKKSLPFGGRLPVIRIGFKPMTYCLEGSCSIQLSYRTNLQKNERRR
jgi:hypothetical protein